MIWPGAPAGEYCESGLTIHREPRTVNLVLHRSLREEEWSCPPRCAGASHGGGRMQKALKLETLRGFTPGHLATVGRRALGGSYDF